MSLLANIEIGTGSSPSTPFPTGNTLPLLHQIRHALRQFLDTGETCIIDLRAIPFGPGDEERLFGFLGEGEVTANVDALGPSSVRETAFPGVWVVEHNNPAGERTGLLIEITEMPALLKTQPGDVAEALSRLDASLRIPGEAGG